MKTRSSMTLPHNHVIVFDVKLCHNLVLIAVIFPLLYCRFLWIIEVPGSMVSNIVELTHMIAACLELEGNIAFTSNHSIYPDIIL